MNIPEKIREILKRYNVEPQPDLVRELEKVSLDYSVSLAMDQHKNRHMKPTVHQTTERTPMEDLFNLNPGESPFDRKRNG